MSVIAYSHHMEYLLVFEGLWSLGCGMGHYLDVTQYTLKVLCGVPRSCPRPLFECPLCDV